MTLRFTIFFTFVSLIALGSAVAAERKIAYAKADQVWVANLDGSKAKKIAPGDLPRISPDGAQVAFNTSEMSKTRPGPERHIAVADSVSGKVSVFKELPSDNCFGPVWSPDGKQLAFFAMIEKEWHLALVNADGTDFRAITNPNGKPDAFGAPEWARDGKSIYCHDLDRIYQIDLEGKILNSWELSKVLKDASMNSNDRLSLSADGKQLLMDADTGSEHERKDWDGPQPALYTFDLTSQAGKRISGKDDFIWDPCWLSESEFLAIMQGENEKEPSIYRVSLDGKKKLIVRQARGPSVSR